MEIAVTADVHLDEEHPERGRHFDRLLGRLETEGITTVIIAGDLLDSGTASVPGFEEIARAHPDTAFHIIRGNHDHSLRSGQIAAENVTVYDEPTFTAIDGAPVLFLPYALEAATMGEALEQSGLAEELPSGRYVLVSHGDYGGVRREVSGDEAGYFPLTPGDLSRYGPARALLGHIHLPGAGDSTVRYPGSPYPLDRSETGQRRILLLDAETLRVRSRSVEDAPVYLDLEVLMVPGEEERRELGERVRETLERAAESYEGEGFAEKAAVRMKVVGFAREREGIAETVRSAAADVGLGQEQVELANEVAIAAADERSAVAQEVRKRAAPDAGEVDPDRLLRRALEYVFGEG
ncbi:MAG: exonuclease SbcCD subunit D [Spirochaetaceae bacterium]